MKVHTVCNMQVAVISTEKHTLFVESGVKRQLVYPASYRANKFEHGLDQKLYTTMSQLGVL